MIIRSLLLLFLIQFSFSALAQLFEPIDNLLPPPNDIRTATGKPGSKYWQQQVDYKMNIVLDDESQMLKGTARITYHNNSPEALNYLWLQIDQNVRSKDGKAQLSTPTSLGLGNQTVRISYTGGADFEGLGMNIDFVNDSAGQKLVSIINEGFLRVDLPMALQPGRSIVFNIGWNYKIHNRRVLGGRSGYEYFPEDDNRLYALCQFYPRLAVFDDVNGWQLTPFLGPAEFALEFGNYEVAFTAPKGFVVAATGMLQNVDKVLTIEQLEKYNKAIRGEKQLIINEKEARDNEKDRQTGTQTWIYWAENVRDFAISTSRKFIWEAQNVNLYKEQKDRFDPVLAQAFYPKEGNPLWGEESLNGVINTLRSYSSRTFTYPYPQATIVNAANLGMEYPMLGFSYGRPVNGKYNQATKDRMVSVVIHEVGHNFFPMIVNSDERLWAWMDEGFNSFLQYLTEKDYYPGMYHRRGPPETIVGFMGDNESKDPIMTTANNNIHNHKVSYDKVSVALNLLREEVLGKESFDKAFKEYANAWKFRHPTPADFFRMMEQSSGTKLDWFWRGWFYTNNFIDMSVDLKYYMKVGGKGDPKSFSTPGELYVTEPIINPEGFNKQLDFQEELTIESVREKYKDFHFYSLVFKNRGRLAMPIHIEFEYESGKKEEIKLPAEIWRYDSRNTTRSFALKEKLKKITVDPENKYPDTNRANNSYPRSK